MGEPQLFQNKALEVDEPRVISHEPEENENYRLAHKYVNLYVDSLVDEYKYKKENFFLVQSMDKITAELKAIKSELSEIKHQNELLTESYEHIAVTRMSGTRSIGGQTLPNSQVRRDILKNVLMEDISRLDDGDFDDDYEDDIEDDDLYEDDDEEELSALPPKVAKKSKHAAKVETKPIKKTAAAEQPKKPPVVKIISNVLFYACMALLIIGAITFSQSKDIDKSLFGFRYYYIKTASMEPELPVGSVVFTKITPPDKIVVGDDITIFIGDESNDSYLTHRVVEITKDNTGELAFRTKGINNKSNDPTPFNAKLVVGRVVFCIPFLGTVMAFVQSQLVLVIGIFVLLLALSFMLRLLFAKPSDETEEEDEPEPVKVQKKQIDKKKNKTEERLKQQQALEWIAAHPPSKTASRGGK